jgi:hypothetical protein
MPSWAEGGFLGPYHPRTKCQRLRQALPVVLRGPPLECQRCPPGDSYSAWFLQTERISQGNGHLAKTVSVC